jgi:hypothetical protein
VRQAYRSLTLGKEAEPQDQFGFQGPEHHSLSTLPLCRPILTHTSDIARGTADPAETQVGPRQASTVLTPALINCQYSPSTAAAASSCVVPTSHTP